MIPGKLRRCVFCSTLCEDLVDSNQISPIQARVLSTIFSFEATDSLSSEIEATYVNSPSCSPCQEWVTEAESVVMEYEQVVDKIRIIGSRLKQIIAQASIKNQSDIKPIREAISTTRKSRKRQREETTAYSEDEHVYSLVPHDDALESALDIEQLTTHVDNDVSTNCNLGDLNTDLKPEGIEVVEVEAANEDPDWIPDEEDLPIVTVDFPPGELRRKDSKLKRSSRQYFNRAQTAVLKKKYEKYKGVLVNSRWDDADPQVREIWIQVAEAVSAVRADDTKDSRACWKKLQHIIREEKMQPTSSYTVETSGTTVTLKHFLLQLIRCDDPNFVPYGRKKPGRPSYNEDYRLAVKHLRQKSQRRQAYNSKLKKQRKPYTHSVKKIRPDEKEGESCFVLNCSFASADPDHLSGHYRGKHLNDPYPFKCVEQNCGKVFSEFGRLRLHRGVHRGYYPFVCKHCGKGFLRGDAHHRHILQRHSEKPKLYSCHICSRQFRVEQSIAAHIKYYHSQQQVHCTVEGCKYEAKHHPQLRGHLRRAHPELFPPPPRPEQHICPECGKIVSKPNFELHMRFRHSGAPIEELKPHKCSHPDCSYRATHKSAVDKHFTNVHVTTERQYSCTVPNCTTKLKSVKGVERHVNRVHGPKDDGDLLYCDRCEGTFKSKKGLEHHIAVTHDINYNAYVCSKCGRGYSIKKYLDRHRLKYPNCQPVQVGPESAFCDICKKHCSNQSGLRRHTHLVHNSKLRPFECYRCGKTFPIKMYLTRHELTGKNCVAKTPEKKVEIESSAEDKTETLMKSSEVTAVQFKKDETKVTRREIKVAPKRKRIGIKKVVTKPSTTIIATTPQIIPQSQVQQNIFYAIYGYENEGQS